MTRTNEPQRIETTAVFGRTPEGRVDLSIAGGPPITVLAESGQMVRGSQVYGQLLGTLISELSADQFGGRAMDSPQSDDAALPTGLHGPAARACIFELARWIGTGEAPVDSFARRAFQSIAAHDARVRMGHYANSVRTSDEWFVLHEWIMAHTANGESFDEAIKSGGGTDDI